MDSKIIRTVRVKFNNNNYIIIEKHKDDNTLSFEIIPHSSFASKLSDKLDEYCNKVENDSEIEFDFNQFLSEE
jgi:hypothetical protein